MSRLKSQMGTDKMFFLISVILLSQLDCAYVMSALLLLQECTVQRPRDLCDSSKFPNGHVEAAHRKDSDHADFAKQLPLPQQPGISLDVIQFPLLSEC